MNLGSRLKVAGLTARLLRSQWWGEARIRRYQADRLGNILQHALHQVPYYQDIVDPGAPTNAETLLHRFPILQKPQVQDDVERFLMPTSDIATWHNSRTSGSTGEPTTTYFDNNCWLLCKYALKARRVLNAGWPLGQRLLVITEQSDGTKETLSHVSMVRRLFATLNLTVENAIADNLRAMVDFGPTMIYGYPSYLGYLTECLRDAGFQLPVVPVVFTSSEIVTPAERQHLENAYGGRVIDVYGSTEFKEIAVQCEQGRYHINFESVFVEALPDPAAGHPRILVTTLVNKAMPLIRYDIGDHAEFGNEACPCGRQGPHLLQPHGRAAEMLHFPNGDAVTPFVLTSAIGAFAEIKNYTIVHAAPHDIRLKVFAKPRLDDQRRAALIADVAAKLPDDVKITVEPLDQRLPEGKRVTVFQSF